MNALGLVAGLWTAQPWALTGKQWECGPFRPWIETGTPPWGGAQSRSALQQGWCRLEAGRWAKH